MAFVNTYLGGVNPETTQTFPSAPPPKVQTNGTTAATTPPKVQMQSDLPPQDLTTIASYVSRNDETCQASRFSDVGEKSSLGKMLYPLVDKKCLFQETSGTFGPKTSVTYREALINIMKYYGIKPNSGTSHFLDIPIGDNLQGYASVAYRRDILSGNYAHPDRLLSKEEFIELLVKIGKPESNPSQIQIYADVSPMNPRFQALQDYAFLIRARGGKLYPQTIMTRGLMAQMLKGIPQKK